MAVTPAEYLGTWLFTIARCALQVQPGSQGSWKRSSTEQLAGSVLKCADAISD